MERSHFPVTDSSFIPVVLKDTSEFASKVVMKYEQNVITLHFASTDYTMQGNIRYRYKLQGFNNTWISFGVVGEATYTNLNSSNYTFFVPANYKNGTWGSKMTSLNIGVISPWWQSWWFYLTLFTIVSSNIYVLYRYKVYQTAQIERLRNRIARDLHDEVGSSISTIAIYSRIAYEQSGNETFDNKPLLKRITDSATEIMESMNDIVWNINTQNDNFEHIISRMREHVYQLLEAKGYAIHLDFDQHLNQIKLSMEKRRDFYLIYKEAVNNIAKYADGKNVWITLKLHHNEFEFTIKDDGKGFDTESGREGGNGLTNMRYRAAALNGGIKITSHPGEGTEIILTFIGSH
ncbi:ATP-binding protein [Segetibacter koreensis]|uniref:ATP-binding protein n=1 Tax=Segetibacter koreensis TaxID=398037 RepID=UPI00037BBF38|nr:triple tyrosine motif-containing protein [Segetibacter koreensis]